MRIIILLIKNLLVPASTFGGFLLCLSGSTGLGCVLIGFGAVLAFYDATRRMIVVTLLMLAFLLGGVALWRSGFAGTGLVLIVIGAMLSGYNQHLANEHYGRYTILVCNIISVILFTLFIWYAMPIIAPQLPRQFPGWDEPAEPQTPTLQTDPYPHTLSQFVGLRRFAAYPTYESAT